MSEIVLIVGVGPGLSSSIARLCASKKMKVILAARDVEKLENLKKEIDAITISCDASDMKSVQNLFKEVDKIGVPNLVIYNPSMRVKGSITEIEAIQVQKAINITCFGAFLVAQEASKRMLERKSGFAMGKFALRGLAQSLARELHPQNIHIGHFVIDGAIGREPYGDYQTMHPDEIAKSYLSFYDQEKSAWAWEIELRTSVEKF